jgi:hypothetical protein
VRFDDPRRINPYLDVRATTRIRTYDVTMWLSGRADDLRIRLSSEPPLPQEDSARAGHARRVPAPSSAPRRARLRRRGRADSLERAARQRHERSQPSTSSSSARTKRVKTSFESASASTTAPW